MAYAIAAAQTDHVIDDKISWIPTQVDDASTRFLGTVCANSWMLSCLQRSAQATWSRLASIILVDKRQFMVGIGEFINADDTEVSG